jgi:hypothetical protein
VAEPGAEQPHQLSRSTAARSRATEAIALVRVAGPAPGSTCAPPLAILRATMALFARKPDLPADLHEAWRSFLDCAEVIEGGRRVLLGVLPTGRVEPAPIGMGTDAVRRAITDARTWMPRWHLDELTADWQDCMDALDEAEQGCTELDEVAASTGELEELLEAVQDVIEPLDVFADAERAWRRRYRLPRERP